MKSLFFKLFAVLYLSGQLSAQSMREIILPFNNDQSTAMENDVREVIDSVYDVLNDGEKVRLRLYNREERKTRTHEQLIVLTQNRYKLVNAYLAARKRMPLIKIPEVVPFTNVLPDRVSITDHNIADLDQPIPGLPAVILKREEPFEKYYTHLAESARIRNAVDYDIYADRDFTISTPSGLQVLFAANSFVKENGMRHSCTNVRIVLEQYLTMSDMIAADLVTHSKGKLLESGGMIYIEAWCGEDKLKLAPGKSFRVLFPSNERKKGMKAWSGHKTENADDWVQQFNGKVQRIPEEVKQENPVESESEVNYESEGEGNYQMDVMSREIYNMSDGYLLTSFNLGWINCDRFVEIEEKTDLVVQSNSKEEVCYRLVFQEIKSVMPAYRDGSKDGFRFSQVPKGERVVLLAYYISRDKSVGLFAAKEIVIGENQNEFLQMQNINPDQLKGKLSDWFLQ